MPYLPNLRQSVGEPSEMSIGTPAEYMQAAVGLHGQNDFSQCVASVQAQLIALERCLEHPQQLYREPQADYGSLALDVKPSEPESTDGGLGQAKALRDQLALEQSARDLSLAPDECFSNDSITSDEGALHDQDVCPTPSSSSADCNGLAEPEPTYQLDEKPPAVQPHDDDGIIREELLHQTSDQSNTTTKTLAKKTVNTAADLEDVSGAVKLPRRGTYVDQPDVKPDIAEANTSNSPIADPSALTNPVPDTFYDDIPSEVFFDAIWVRPSSFDADTEGSESGWTKDTIMVWIVNTEPEGLNEG